MNSKNCVIATCCSVHSNDLPYTYWLWNITTYQYYYPANKLTWWPFNTLFRLLEHFEYKLWMRRMIRILRWLPSSLSQPSHSIKYFHLSQERQNRQRCFLLLGWTRKHFKGLDFVPAVGFSHIVQINILFSMPAAAATSYIRNTTTQHSSKPMSFWFNYMSNYFLCLYLLIYIYFLIQKAQNILIFAGKE